MLRFEPNSLGQVISKSGAACPSSIRFCSVSAAAGRSLTATLHARRHFALAEHPLCRQPLSCLSCSGISSCRGSPCTPFPNGCKGFVPGLHFDLTPTPGSGFFMMIVLAGQSPIGCFAARNPHQLDRYHLRCSFALFGIRLVAIPSVTTTAVTVQASTGTPRLIVLAPPYYVWLQQRHHRPDLKQLIWSLVSHAAAGSCPRSFPSPPRQHHRR